MTRRPVPVALLAIALLSCSDAPSYAAFVAYDNAHMSAGTGSDAGPVTGEGSTGAETGAEADADTGTSEATGTGGTSDGEGSTVGDAELVPPRILAVDVPATIHLAGPVPLTVTADHATAIRGTLDGVELELFEDQGGGVWVGRAPIFGAVDNGDHVVEVTATNGPLVDAWPAVSFTVKTPAPGGQAWALTAASGVAAGAAVTRDGDLLEVGSFEVDGVLKPSIRKRSRVNGGELWPEETIVLDDREGAAAAVAVAPDGRIWVALNVKGADKKWRPRIVQLDAEGHATGIEVTTEAGPTVRGVAVDAAGIVAVGFAGSGLGDMDVMTWRMLHDGTAMYTAKPWDYVPLVLDPMPHKFDDLAFDVVIVDGAAWVVGASTGKHDGLGYDPTTRGFVVRLDLETGEALGPAAIAVPVNALRNSMFLAGAPHPDGVVVVGNESNDDGTTQMLTLQAFNASNARTYHASEWSAAVAYGTGVAWSAHGTALITAVVHDGQVLRGVLLGRGGPGANFDHLFPGTEPSAATDLALDAYDQVFMVGERTIGGVRLARASRVHQ
ncbi:hypothetical protein OV090_45925 [Nannocystis sp. RBIL2]|uniref:hypothetical protein n=1 Tax=Nannocystis sp. RBIL2 TaxID=2996788 RepID=UPI00226D5DD8|nr:hypothetical protein [Nannocystis sp. RBIL2]MCY1072172.1 hypothetical protein [Nannocystis sp. RBIL2]